MPRHREQIRFVAIVLGALACFLAIAPSPGLCEARSYRVRRGDSLWKIAERFLGNGLLWRKLYRKNDGDISNPSLISVGMELKIPGVAKKDEKPDPSPGKKPDPSSGEKAERTKAKKKADAPVETDALTGLMAETKEERAKADKGDPAEEKAEKKTGRKTGLPVPERNGVTPGARGCNKALDWALHRAQHTPNPRKPGVSGAKAWAGWCLGFVKRAWGYGAKRWIPQLEANSAKDSLGRFRRAKMLRPIRGRIPRGAPVFWGNGDFGHVAIATGKTDRNGEPLICSTYSDKTTGGGIFIRPLSYFTKYNGRAAGWGLIRGTPLS